MDTTIQQGLIPLPIPLSIPLSSAPNSAVAERRQNTCKALISNVFAIPEERFSGAETIFPLSTAKNSDDALAAQRGDLGVVVAGSRRCARRGAAPAAASVVGCRVSMLALSAFPMTA
jgi:hypothetical protein